MYEHGSHDEGNRVTNLYRISQQTTRSGESTEVVNWTFYMEQQVQIFSQRSPSLGEETLNDAFAKSVEDINAMRYTGKTRSACSMYLHFDGTAHEYEKE